MNFVLIILISALFLGMKLPDEGKFHYDYSSQKQTSIINGLFTLLIFFSHASQYISLGGSLDDAYLSFRTYMGQLVVASFLFFSGFGIMESISKKGNDYVKSIPSKRLFRVWYHFAFAIILFLAVAIIFNTKYSAKRILLSFIGYMSIGNSNWYMFVTFAMYIIIYISFMIGKKHKAIGLTLVFALSVGFAVFESKIGLHETFYNTLFCLPFGMLFSVIKPYFDRFVMKNDLVYLLSTGAIIIVYYIFEQNRALSVFHYNAFAILAVILIMMVTMKVKIGNPILEFFSKHIFSFFILQRIPMIILDNLGVSDNKYSFVILSFVATLCMSVAFDNLTKRTDALIFKK